MGNLHPGCVSNFEFPFSNFYFPAFEAVGDVVLWPCPTGKRTARAGIGGIDNAHKRLYKDSMKTLTITDAKKNLSRWLDAAARGQDIGIVRGADIIALRKVEIESTDYAQREYAATPDQVEAFAEATEKRYRRLKRSGKLVTVTTEQLRNMLE